ncbi:glutamine-hydrolyzing carbamoyl-phosphate synthase small subunit [Patescibacteria group bacterium]|nr:glutamine-hydrolyzing carbamoyl-phosphate synthase small subunit [Patescibacteria group bacterium]MBU1123151.1 glutamine-hydrolyzing carbamoyl-phosphate synthase small subunit [Patescibacteria group bacterium]MBU1911754.1 glutamine-hydrolyzing carbamoyl-phosphate synthase small subunit [Patescibacteria group bacterium]
MIKLVLQDGTQFSGQSFGSTNDISGEVVFNTGMAGYVESLTDPSYRGQILVFTYPLIGNYGVPSGDVNEWGFSKNFESEAIHVRGVIVAQESRDFSHFNAVSSLHNWMEHHGIPGITGVDTRALTKKLREHGVMLGRIIQCQDSESTFGRNPEVDIEDPNLLNLVAEVSCKEVKTYKSNVESRKSNVNTVVVFDCGIKNNILRSFLKRGVTVHRLPWNFDLDASDLEYDAVFISNGPGDPKMCKETIAQVGKAIEKGIPTFGICLGTQILALAIGGDTYKLKYGHRGVNQPCLEIRNPPSAGIRDADNGQKCLITSQNHGFAVDEKSLPSDWRVWFTNANDGTVEGIKHESGKFFAVQFHPEATPGPEDADYLFDSFLSVI